MDNVRHGTDRDGGLAHASFFSGIGGFDLAFDRAGFRTACQSEIDRYCLSILARHWPSVHRFGDISKLSPDDAPNAAVWTAGFPCQDVSLARGNHKRPGFAGSNSSLFFDFFRLVKKRKPTVVLLENVLGLLSSNQGDDFAVVIQSLTKAGYGVAWRVLNTRYFGAPQSRQRVFVCAFLGDSRRAARVLFDDAPQHVEDPRAAFREVHQCGETGAYVPRISFCVAATSGRHTGNDWSRTYVAYENRVRRPTPGETEALQGFPKRWTIPGSEYRGRAVGIFDSERYKALGNAVSVPVAYWLANRIQSELARTQSDSSGLSSSEAGQWSRSEECRSRKLSKRSAGKWASGGVVQTSVAYEFPSAETPRLQMPSRFVDVLTRDEDIDAYFISANAARGMLRRADTLNRRFFEPLDRALRALASEQ